MTIDLERLPNCSIHLRVEAPAKTVQERKKKLVRAFAQQARIPGYRPGKVPDAMIETRYKAEIEQELKESMIGEGLREAIRQEDLKLVAVTSVKDVDLEPDLTFRFHATLSVEPEFELPEYIGIPVSLPSIAATEEEIEGMLNRLQEQDATFEDIQDRPVQLEDYAVVDSIGTLGSKPLQEVFEDLPPNIAHHENLWIRVAEGVFLPGFAEQLVGMQVGETRTFDLLIPSDFMVKAIAGETLEYRVTIRELKRRVLPEVTPEFCQRKIGVESVEEARREIARIISQSKEMDLRQETRRQVLDHLIAKVDCELPAHLVEEETRRVVDRIVGANTARGVSEDLMKEKSSEIVTMAARAAQSKVRGDFILKRIAKQENITLSRPEFSRRFAAMAAEAREDAGRLLQDLKKKDLLGVVEDDFIRDKTIEFLCEKALLQQENTPATTEDAKGEGMAPSRLPATEAPAS